MKIRKGISIGIVILMLLGVIIPSPAATAVAAPSYDEASIYMKISVVTSYNKNEETGSNNLSGIPDKTTSKDNFSILVEGTTELKADMFDSEDGYKELFPDERDIRASCSGSGSKST